jgi:hypothetical protein
VALFLAATVRWGSLLQHFSGRGMLIVACLFRFQNIYEELSILGEMATSFDI